MRECNSKRRVVAGMSNALAMAMMLGFVATTAQAQQTAAVQEGAVAGEANPFFDKARFGYQQRTAYFDRDLQTSRPRAMGFGGWLYGQTGEIADILSFGGTYNFTIPLYSPDYYPPSTEASQYNYILRDPGQSTNSVIGEAYAKVRFGDQAAVFGRQTIRQAWYLPDVVRFYNKLDQSMIGPRDVRGMQNIHYEAATYQGRFMNDTLRAYAGFVWNARQINANKFTPVDATLIPTGELKPVDGTPFDFRRPTAIGARINQDDPQLKFGGGYDHNWVINQKNPGELTLQARVTEPTTGRVLVDGSDLWREEAKASGDAPGWAAPAAGPAAARIMSTARRATAAAAIPPAPRRRLRPRYSTPRPRPRRHPAAVRVAPGA